MSQQGNGKSRGARRGGAKSQRGRSSDLPARLRRARHRIAAAQGKREHARSRRRQHQPSRGGQVERHRLAKRFQQHRCQRRTADRFGAGAQQRQRIGGLHKHQPRRIEPQIGQPQAIGPVMPRGAILAQPQHRARPAATQRQQQSEGSDARCIPLPSRIKFMQRSDCQPAAQPRIDRIEPQRQAQISRRGWRLGQARKGRQGFGTTHYVHYMF